MPKERASSSSNRLGYMPGSWVRMPARKAAGWWVFSHAEWKVGRAKAAAWALQNPKLANDFSTSQMRSRSSAV